MIVIKALRRYFERLLAPYTDFMDRQYARLLAILSAMNLFTVAAFVISLGLILACLLAAWRIFERQEL